MSGFEIFAVTPPSYLVRSGLANGKEQIQSLAASSLIAFAATQAGYVGIIDLQFLDIESDICRRDLLASMDQWRALPGVFGIKCGASQLSGVRSFFASLKLGQGPILFPNLWERAPKLLDLSTHASHRSMRSAAA